jgi:RimJ/RimL family protein N-acetyltransferase
MAGPDPVRTRLRPARPDEAELLLRWRATPTSEYDDFTGGPVPSSHDTRPQHAPAGLGELVVTDGRDVLLGSVSWHEVSYGPNRGSTAYNIGISLRPEARGSGHGSRAQRMLADYLFTTFPVHRVEASTDVTNLREQRSLEKAGFTREGILRGAQWRSGGYHDLVSYACLRGEGERVADGRTGRGAP